MLFTTCWSILGIYKSCVADVKDTKNECCSQLLLKCSDILLDQHLIHVRAETAKNDNESFCTIPASIFRQDPK